MLGHNPEFTNEVVTKNPSFRPVSPDLNPLKAIVHSLESEVFGQPRAMETLSRSLLRTLAGMDMPDRPAFSGLFAGPPGVGKTETGKALARYYHPGDDWAKYLRIVDCSNLTGEDSINRLIGSPPGYVGSGNPDLVLINPNFFQANTRTVVIFDEFEKAHMAIWRQALSILDRGRLQMVAGAHQYSPDSRVIDTDWSNTVVIFTTNIGSREMIDTKKGKSMGFVSGGASRNTQGVLRIGEESVRRYFRMMPEFLDRLDEVVIFDHLGPESYANILEKFIEELNGAQRVGNNPLGLTYEAKQHLVSLTSETSGGRGLRRIFEREIVTPAAAIKISLDANQPIIAGYEPDKGVIFWVGELEEKKALAAFS